MPKNSSSGEAGISDPCFETVTEDLISVRPPDCAETMAASPIAVPFYRRQEVAAVIIAVRADVRLDQVACQVGRG